MTRSAQGTIAGFAKKRNGYFCSESQTNEMPDFAWSRNGQFYLLSFKNSSFIQRLENIMAGVEKTGYNQCRKSYFARSQKGQFY